MTGMDQFFTNVASRISSYSGKAATFILAVLVIVVWGSSGPLFGFSDTWQLVVNTGTTIVTFLMVFLIQNTQNRDALAMHLKLDELISSIEAADDGMIDAEDQTDESLAELKQKYASLCAEHETLKQKVGAVATNGVSS